MITDSQLVDRAFAYFPAITMPEAQTMAERGAEVAKMQAEWPTEAESRQVKAALLALIRQSEAAGKSTLIAP